MRLRMYVTLPDTSSARKLANDLLLARIEDRHMHFLARRGTDLGILSAKGSLYVTRPTLISYTAKRDELVAAAKDLFDMVLSGKVKVSPRQSYALKDAAQAHRDLEARKTTGSTILVP
jgi:NADPH:quinone reductase-like Zn-dependent oxidoreductase